METAQLLSAVCPVFNEELCLLEFHERLTRALQSIEPSMDFEIIYVDDGSRDSSPDILRSLCKEDHRVRLLRLSRNFGHQSAITAGIDEAKGEAVVVIDTDLQDPPEVIPKLVELWRGGNDVVYGVRARRPGESRFKLASARIFYRTLNRLSDVEMPLDSGDFRLLDRKVVDQLCAMRERNRYVRGLVAWIGFKQTALEYDRASRHSGESKYSITRMLRLAVDAVTSFSEKPLRLALQLGMLSTLGALLLAIKIVVGKILAPDQALPGFASVMAAVLLLGGIQLFCLGLLGEYVARIYLESKSRPLYVVGDRVNFDKEDEGHEVRLDDLTHMPGPPAAPEHSSQMRR